MRNTSTTNKAQRDYMTAKALLQTLEEREAEIEKAYIVANGIQNADGTIPERVYCIDDMETFDKANAETAAEVEGCGLWAEILAARDALTAAEDTMIAYGISLAPAALRATLERGVKENFKTRQKMIELARQAAVEAMNAASAAHAVYAVKHYDRETGTLAEADIYCPAVVLDDDEFYKRTEAEAKEHPGCYILAAHAHK